ncbi:MAG: DsbA family protein [Patescibacteria group bacterium]
MKQSQTTLLPFVGAILLAAIVTLYLFLRFTLLPTTSQPINTGSTFEPAGNPLVTGTRTPTITEPTTRSDDFSYGASDAPVKIVIFSDFDCPYCRDMATLLKSEVDTNKKARLVWRDFPVSSVHPNVLVAHTAAWCAGKEGKFWEFHDALFATTNHYQDNLLALGSALGLKSNTFTACMESTEAKNMVLRNVQEGNALGVDGTPYLFINDQRVSGLITSEELTQVINLHATKQ